LGAACAVLLFALRRTARPTTAVMLASLAVFVGLLPVRNLLASGGLTGHEVGVTAADTFASAMQQALREFCTVWLWSAYHARPIVTNVGGSVVLVALALLGLRRFRYALVSALPIVYVVALSLAASRTRIDTISDRYVEPIVPLVVISMVVAAYTWRVGPWWRYPASRWIGGAVGVMVLAVVALAVRGGLERVVSGHTPPAANYSPETLAYIRRTIGRGATIAGNRFGKQICATTLDYGYVGIPFDDPFNADYPKAYGVKLWTRDAALEMFRRHDVQHVVFFLGPEAKDPFLDAGAYGEYIGALAKGQLSEIQAVTRLPDGFIVSLHRAESSTSSAGAAAPASDPIAAVRAPGCIVPGGPSILG
jgi:hypothetical protein